jgi:5-methylcytosine-specific restriction protein A
MRYCSHPRCPVLVPHGRCQAHQFQQRQVQTRYTKGNYGRPWRRLRDAFLEQAYPWFCAIQGSACTAKGRAMQRAEVDVDHVIPHRGDPVLRDDITNLQVTCRACHSQKTATEVSWHG